MGLRQVAALRAKQKCGTTRWNARRRSPWAWNAEAAARGLHDWEPADEAYSSPQAAYWPLMWSRTRRNSSGGEKSMYSESSSASGAWLGGQ